MKRLIPLLWLLFGCANAPVDVRQSGQHELASSNLEPILVAGCITRNVESMTFGVGFKAMVQVRPGRRGTLEVIVYGEPSMHGALAVADVKPSGVGSSIEIWRARSGLMGAWQLERMANGC